VVQAEETEEMVWKIAIDVSDAVEKVIGPATAVIRQSEGAILVRLPDDRRTILVHRATGEGILVRLLGDQGLVLPEELDIPDLPARNAPAPRETLPDPHLPNAQEHALLPREEMLLMTEDLHQDPKEMKALERPCARSLYFTLFPRTFFRLPLFCILINV